MLVEDWLRGCVNHDGRHGEVTLPCDEVLGIADYIESTRTKVEVVRCKDCADWQSSWHPMGVPNDCNYCATMDCYMKPDDYCSYGEKDGDTE